MVHAAVEKKRTALAGRAATCEGGFFWFEQARRVAERGGVAVRRDQGGTRMNTLHLAAFLTNRRNF